jgi:hypothetical protein
MLGNDFEVICNHKELEGCAQSQRVREEARLYHQYKEKKINAHQLAAGLRDSGTRATGVVLRRRSFFAIAYR